MAPLEVPGRRGTATLYSKLGPGTPLSLIPFLTNPIPQELSYGISSSAWASRRLICLLQHFPLPITPCPDPAWGGWGNSEACPPSQLGVIGSGQAVAYGVDSGCCSNLPKSWVEAHGLQGVCGEGTHLSLSQLRPLGCRAWEFEALLCQTWEWVSVCAGKGLQINPSTFELLDLPLKGTPQSITVQA